MGSLDVKIISTQKQLNDFTRHLLSDMRALEQMLENDDFTKTPVKIGAEQEICLVNNHFKPAPVSLEVLEALNDPDFTTELAKFNLEVNLPPLEFTGNVFSTLEGLISDKLNNLKAVLQDRNLHYILTGILPTLRKFDLEMDNLTPLNRYIALMKAIAKMRGSEHELRIKGIDELNLKHDSAMLEACNTSFQVHLQVDPKDFVHKYNVAQVLLAPVMSIASNSPVLFGKRLWRETRIALFQQSIDTRRTGEHLRDRSPRVMFGNTWLKKSVIEVFREDIVRFRPMLMTTIKKDSVKMKERGEVPRLSALGIHNSTVYRWNRACYGISEDGKPHLRIENRTFPSGPTVVDEVANAAFWVGCMESMSDLHKDVTKEIEFDDVKSNFITAAFNGLHAELNWVDGKKYPAPELIKEILLPMARQGLKSRNVPSGEIDKYLGIIEERNETRKTGAQWTLDSFVDLLKEDMGREELPVALTANMYRNEQKGIPGHKWKNARVRDIKHWHPEDILVEEFMTIDLVTVHQNDIPELVADMMDWQKIRYTPVEDTKGYLIGLISSRILMRYFNENTKQGNNPEKKVRDLMIKNPITISPESTVYEAMHLFREHQIGCLPVVKNKKLVGIVTEGNFLGITRSLLKVIKESDKPSDE